MSNICNGPEPSPNLRNHVCIVTHRYHSATSLCSNSQYTKFNQHPGLHRQRNVAWGCGYRFVERPHLRLRNGVGSAYPHLFASAPIACIWSESHVFQGYVLSPYPSWVPYTWFGQRSQMINWVLDRSLPWITQRQSRHKVNALRGKAHLIGWVVKCSMWVRQPRGNPLSLAVRVLKKVTPRCESLMQARLLLLVAPSHDIVRSLFYFATSTKRCLRKYCTEIHPSFAMYLHMHAGDILGIGFITLPTSSILTSTSDSTWTYLHRIKCLLETRMCDRQEHF